MALVSRYFILTCLFAVCIKSLSNLQNFSMEIRRCVLKFCHVDKTSICNCVLRIDSYAFASFVTLFIISQIIRYSQTP